VSIDLHELFEVEGDTLGHTRGLYCTGHVDKAEFAARANRWEADDYEGFDQGFGDEVFTPPPCEEADVRHVLWRRETYCESIGEPCARECSCNWTFSEHADGQPYTVWDWERAEVTRHV
jgi:hypothetical protein